MDSRLRGNDEPKNPSVTRFCKAQQVTYGAQLGDDTARECMAAAHDAGVNFFVIHS
jgi:hypothetical protein